MGSFKFKGDSYGPGMYQPPGTVPFHKKVNTPDLILNGGLVNPTTGAPATLPATGFAIADILQVFQVSMGFCLRHMGARVTAIDGGSFTVGNVSATQTHLLAASAAGYIASVSLGSLASVETLVAAAHLGPDNYTGVIFVTNGSIDITFAAAACDTGIFDLWADGYSVPLS